MRGTHARADRPPVCGRFGLSDSSALQSFRISSSPPLCRIGIGSAACGTARSIRAIAKLSEPRILRIRYGTLLDDVIS
jgi:hypothetical protein